eukprot:1157106-Pelagomonas_calceolata.AAC.2
MYAELGIQETGNVQKLKGQGKHQSCPTYLSEHVSTSFCEQTGSRNDWFSPGACACNVDVGCWVVGMRVNGTFILAGTAS